MIKYPFIENKGTDMETTEMKIINLTPYKRIGGLIPENRLTLVTGLPGSGKSFSLLKFLNQEKIKPIYFNLDEDASLLTMDAIFPDPKHLSDFLDSKITDLKGHTIVIDTYQRVVDLIADKGNTKEFQESFTNNLLKISKEEECTIIVIGHPEDYVGKDSIFKDNQSLVRNCHEHIHLDVILPRGKTVTNTVYRTFIKKGRGITGERIIENWMR
jgi:predicted ATP-dependent serine protease